MSKPGQACDPGEVFKVFYFYCYLDRESQNNEKELAKFKVQNSVPKF